jgi:hypothetical protein
MRSEREKVLSQVSIVGATSDKWRSVIQGLTDPYSLKNAHV